eukprot:11165192-Lingulodinium_polyedra.AAC.1
MGPPQQATLYRGMEPGARSSVGAGGAVSQGPALVYGGGRPLAVPKLLPPRFSTSRARTTGRPSATRPGASWRCA